MISEQKFRVIVTNDILGNSEHIRTLDEIKNHNLCAYRCALKCSQDGKPHSDGMWTVERMPLLKETKDEDSNG